MGTVLLRGGKAMHLDGLAQGAPVDIGIAADGIASLAGRSDDTRAFDRGDAPAGRARTGGSADSMEWTRRPG